MPIIINGFNLSKLIPKYGSHSSAEVGMCIMELAAYVAGRGHGDHPPCVDNLFSSLMINWNDAFDDSVKGDRQRRFLKFLLPDVLGTRPLRYTAKTVNKEHKVIEGVKINEALTMTKFNESIFVFCLDLLDKYFCPIGNTTLKIDPIVIENLRALPLNATGYNLADKMLNIYDGDWTNLEDRNWMGLDAVQNALYSSHSTRNGVYNFYGAVLGGTKIPHRDRSKIRAQVIAIIRDTAAFAKANVAEYYKTHPKPAEADYTITIK